MEEENKKVNRRKFLEDSSNKALVGSAAVFLGLSMIKPKAAQAYTCSGACTGDCTYNCKGDCYGTCKGDCYGTCMGDCTDSCEGTCYEYCSGTSSPSGASPQAQHDTPVSEREVSTRHVTV